MNRSFSIVIFIALSFTLSFGTPQQLQAQQKKSGGTTQQSQSQTQVPTSPYFTGDGGKNISIAILTPKATGLAENQGYLPTLVQGEFVSNFSGYSAISVLDRERLDNQYAELLSGYYNDYAKEGMDLGHLTPTTHIMGGSITRTATGYALQMQITKSADKMTTASYSGTFTFAELDNLTGIRRASLDLIQKMGVTLTAQAKEELTRAAMDNHVNAQTTLAKGITAQKQGTEVAALSYYFQAASFDPSLLEAVNRSSILNANISSGNIGDNIRNDIQWRKDWIARLTETEQFLDSFNRTESMPYTLFYVSDEIKQIGEINYKNETVTMGGIETNLHGSGIWTVSIERALQAVYDGLDATKRKDVWGLGSWPRQGVTNLNFTGRSRNFAVVFELLNNQNKVIGRQTLQSGGSWGINRSSGRPVISVNADDKKTLNFQNVNANDITDRMTIRIATVDGVNAETAARNGVLQIRAITRKEFDSNNSWRFAKGELQGYVNRPERKQGYGYRVNLPNTIWGDPVISIGRQAFNNMSLIEVTIPNSIIIIGESAFANNPLTSVTFPDSVKTIDANAFWRNNAIYGWTINEITIGENVAIAQNAFRYSWRNNIDGRIYEGEVDMFTNTYNEYNKKAGTYHYLSANKWYTPLIIPTIFEGTWKRDNFKSTMSFTSNYLSIKDGQRILQFSLANISGDSYTFINSDRKYRTYGKTVEMIIKIVNGNIVINNVPTNNEHNFNFNGTWKKQM